MSLQRQATTWVASPGFLEEAGYDVVRKLAASLQGPEGSSMWEEIKASHKEPALNRQPCK